MGLVIFVLDRPNLRVPASPKILFQGVSFVNTNVSSFYGLSLGKAASTRVETRVGAICRPVSILLSGTV